MSLTSVELSAGQDVDDTEGVGVRDVLVPRQVRTHGN